MSWSRMVSVHARDVFFDLLVHVLWADGRVTPEELSAARGAANALGMDTHSFGGLFGRVGRPFEALGLEQLGPLERPMAYAVAVWMAMADGELAISENLLLRRTRQSLDIPDRLASSIEHLTMEHARGLPRDSQADAHQQGFETLLERVSASLIA